MRTLQAARQRLGVSQKTAATSAGVSPQALSGWEAGTGGTGAPALKRIRVYCEWLQKQAKASRVRDFDYSLTALCPDLFAEVQDGQH